MTRSNFGEKNHGNKMKSLEILLILYAAVIFFRSCSKFIFVSFGFSFVIKTRVLQAMVIIDRSFLRLIQRLISVKIIVAVATAIICEETESSEESSEETESPESDSSL